MENDYPDISEFLAAKQRGRDAIRRLSFGEKIELMEALRERLRPFAEAREKRKLDDK